MDAPQRAPVGVQEKTIRGCLNKSAVHPRRSEQTSLLFFCNMKTRTAKGVKKSSHSVIKKPENGIKVEANGRRRSSRVKKQPEKLADVQQEQLLFPKARKIKTEQHTRYDPDIVKNLRPAKVFYPTIEEFKDPMTYIQQISASAAADSGICKIVPPAGWNPPCQIDMNDTRKKFDTRVQRIHKLSEGKHYTDGRRHSLASYRSAANDFAKAYGMEHGWTASDWNSDSLAKAYWEIVDGTNQDEFQRRQKVEVEYANDLDTVSFGSGFPKCKNHSLNSVFGTKSYYENTGWNLNNLPKTNGSLLRRLKCPINGVNVPWLYFGMLFATFCWHTEDNYLYSANYMHFGKKKRWYGIAAADAEAFEEVMQDSVPARRFKEDPDLLLHITTMVSPGTLLANDVAVYTVLQEPGEFVITFPQGYHGGFSEGFNCNEAVNFALPEWIQYSTACSERYREFRRSSVFSLDRLLCTLATHNLEEELMTRRTGKVLLKELCDLYEEEMRLRIELHASGLKNIVEMNRARSNSAVIDGATMREDDSRQCRECKHNCFFSGVICPCHRRLISCLRHVTDVCQKCEMSEKFLLEWVKMDELKNWIDNLKAKCEDLRH